MTARLAQPQAGRALGQPAPQPDVLARLIAVHKVETPWLDGEQAASYLCCPVSRVRKLTMTGELPVHREGRRVLFHRDELDEFIRGGGAFSP